MDGRFIDKLALELNERLIQGRINKVYQLSKSDFLFLIRSNTRNESLYLSLSPQIARLHLTDFSYDKPQTPSGFCMLLRKYLEGGQITDISALNDDRIIQIKIENNNDFGEKMTYYGVIELMGKHANLIITDNNYIIIDCYKHVSPFEGQQRTFLRGFKYELPLDGKISPFDFDRIKHFFETNENLRDLIGLVRGLSPVFTDYVFASAHNQPVSLFDNYVKLLNEPVNPTIITIQGKKKFYWFDIFHQEESIHYSSLSKLLDDLYYDMGQLDRTKQISKNIYQLIKREYEKNKDKLERLTSDLNKAKESEIYRIKADLIIQNQNQIEKGMASFETFCYETDKNEVISLDRLLSPIENAKQYYKKYKKIKSSIQHLETQIEITSEEIRYFELLIVQIESASLNDLLEITEELKANKYLHEKPVKAKKQTPHFDTYYTKEGTMIVVGKNNLQNDYITHSLGKHNEMWFHAKEIPGSHVIIRKTTELNEEEIRTAAMLAAYFSLAKESSSVPVDYTLLKYVKKIPGTKGSFVTYTQQKTIYIDPDKQFINQLKNKKQ